MKNSKYLVFIVFLMLFSINTKNVYANTKEINKNESPNLIVSFLENGQTNPNASYNIGGVQSTDKQYDCGELFDQSVIDLINDVLKYPRYIIPPLIILLGTIDFFKIIVSGKEDEMKKAQKTFIKRVIIGVMVFLVPLFVNLVVWLANVAWEGLGYTTCNL